MNETKLKEKEKRILKSAIHLFAEKGFEKTSTREIAQEAGVAEGTIYCYFRTKKDLLFTIFDQCLELLGEKIVVEAITQLFEENKHKSDKDILKELIKNRLKLIEKNLPLVKIFLAEFNHRKEFQKKFFDHVASKGIYILTEYLQKGIDEGRFRNIDPIIVAKSLAGLVYVHLLQEQVKPEVLSHYTLDQQIDMMLDLFLEGLIKR